MDNAKDVRVGVAGLGKMGLLHAAIFNALPGSRLAAVADPAQQPRATLAEINSTVRTYEDTEEMLKAGGLDAVVIATPVATHVPLAIECVCRGIPFLMEKPLATSAEQAGPLVAALRQSPTPHMIGFMTRFVGAFEKGRELVRSECLGHLQRVSATIYVSQLFVKGKGWRYDRKIAGGGVLLSQGSHLLDLLTWYFGPAARVNAEVLSIYSAEVEDSAHLMLEFRSGLRAWMDCSWSVRFRRNVETTIDILGDNGSLTITDDAIRLFLDRASGDLPAGWCQWNAADLYRGVDFDVGGPQYSLEDKAFLAALRNGAMPQPNIQAAFHVQQIIDAAYASSVESGAPKMVSS